MTAVTESVLSKADALYLSGRCDEAVALLSASSSADPSRRDILTKLVDLLIDSEQYVSAMQRLEGCSLDREHPAAALQRAICFEAIGDTASAERICDQLIALDQLRAEALTLKGRLVLCAGQQEWAMELFTEAIKCNSSCGNAWLAIASLKKEKGEPLAAFDFLKQAFLCSPDSRGITAALHESSIETGNIQQAEIAFRQALSRRPLNRRLRFLLIDLQLRQSKYDEAMVEIETAWADFGSDAGMLSAAATVRARLGPMSIHPEKPRGMSVSLCMIVKNEKKHLPRCLLSAKPIIDEIVVVDTGSSDETKGIAHVFGAHVYDYPWEDDFAKARNFSTTKASGGWILVLDADEVISAADYMRFRQLIESSQGQSVAYRIQTRNYSNQVNTVGFRSNQGEYPEEKGLGWYSSDKVRLFPNDNRIRFVYPVHELVEPDLRKFKIPILDCSIAVHHYGTCDELNLSKKTKKYRKLGNKKLKNNLKDPGALKEAAIQSARTGNHAEALKLWQRFIRVRPSSAEAYLNMGTACWNLGRNEEAAAYAQKALRRDPALKEAKFNLAFAFLMLERAGEAQTLLEGLVRDYQDYLAAQFLLCITYACRGENKQAGRLFEILKELPIGDVIDEAFLDVARRFLSASRSNYARCTLDAALEFGCENGEMRALARNCRRASVCA